MYFNLYGCDVNYLYLKNKREDCLPPSCAICALCIQYYIATTKCNNNNLLVGILLKFIKLCTLFICY